MAIYLLKTLAGHRKIQTTASYLYSSPSQLKAALELLFSFGISATAPENQGFGESSSDTV